MTSKMNIKTGNTAIHSAALAKRGSEKIQNAFNRMNKDAFLPKTDPYDWNSITEEQMDTAVMLAYHCCVNGPVGVRTVTNFPGFTDEFSIHSVFNCSNAQWKGFCFEFKTHIPNEVLRTCKAFEMFQGFWPTEREMVEKNQNFLRNDPSVPK